MEERVPEEEETTPESEGIVDQQGAVLERLEEPEPQTDPDVGPMADDPMEGEAPTG